MSAVVHEDMLWAELKRLRSQIALGPYADAAARDAAITAPVAGMRVYLSTPQVWTEYDGTAWRGEWVTNFVPQIDQGEGSGGNIAKTVNWFDYRYDGPMIDIDMYISITGTGSAGFATTFTLPVAPLRGSRAMGHGMMYRNNSIRNVQLFLFSAGHAGIWEHNSGGNASGVDPSYALASGDQFNFALRYRWI